jgi:hypothetical protein
MWQVLPSLFFREEGLVDACKLFFVISATGKKAKEQIIMDIVISIPFREKARFINTVEITKKMEERELLTEQEKRDLLSRDPFDVDLLIKILKRKSDDAFTLFYDALKAETSHLGHKRLASDIEDVL